MNRRRLSPHTVLRILSGLALFLAVVLAIPADTAALERASYDMEILVDGTPLAEYAARGKMYIEAQKGREYSVRLTNRSGERIAVALSVDGLNSIDAKTSSAKEASRWILEGYEAITIDGWQTSSATARRFFFTSEEQSYGAWLGKTKNLGVVSAAVFREKLPEPPPVRRWSGRKDDGCRDCERQEAAAEPAAPKSRAAEGAGAQRLDGNRSAEGQMAPSDSAAPAPTEKKAIRPLSDELAATGIGREVGHQVVRVAFHAEPTPAAVLEVRYEYHDALVRLGVLPRSRRSDPLDPLDRREQAQGFSDTGFAPDPYR